MPLKKPAERELMHHRAVDCYGYRREDGLWDIEGHLKDVKSYSFRNKDRGLVEPGDPIHDMWLRLTMDEDLTIHAVEAVMDSHPYGMCPHILTHYQRLVGLQIGKGWRRNVQMRLGGVEGCTHLVELLAPLATAAFQTIFPLRQREGLSAGDLRPPRHLNTCHALGRASEIVRREYPRWYRPPQNPRRPRDTVN